MTTGLFSGEIGRIESFSMAISREPGYKRALLGARLRHIRVSIIRPRRTQKPASAKPRWCFP